MKFDIKKIFSNSKIDTKFLAKYGPIGFITIINLFILITLINLNVSVLPEIQATLKSLEESNGNSTAAYKEAYEENTQSRLARLELPENPSEEHVRKYIRDILFLSQNEENPTSRDLQIMMLLEIGPENLHYLFDEGAAFSGPHDLYITTAANNLAGEEHKELILDHLPVYTDLIRTVIRFGWENEVKGLIAAALKEEVFLPLEWISAALRIADEAVYEDIINYFVYCENKKSVYKLLKDIKEIDTQSLVNKAWRIARFKDWQALDFCGIAIESGIVDALAFGIELINQPGNENSYYKNSIGRTIRIYTDMDNNPAEIQAWFKENRENIYFNAEIGLYKVK